MTADQYMELIHAGAPEFLIGLLEAADRDEPGARAAVKELAGYWREDGAWRGSMKRSGDWDFISSHIQRIRSGDSGPWWYILDWADSGKIPDRAKEYFAA
ncbi:MAG: hypothetical protein HS116_02245 [Planctomycetes bacterium]|nr:hypothetical protein [Planctomycetota bacterium]